MAIRSDGDRDGPEAESPGFKIGVIVIDDALPVGKHCSTAARAVGMMPVLAATFSITATPTRQTSHRFTPISERSAILLQL